jgi:tartrate dehydrogenase/decarboxylase/D-malate dehydrogenase
MVLSGSMMLRHLGELRAADAVERAVDRVLGRGEIRTADLGGRASTLEMGEALADEVLRAHVT